MHSTTNQKPSQTENNLIILSVPPKWYEKKATHSSGFFVIVPISIPVSMLSAMFEKN